MWILKSAALIWGLALIRGNMVTVTTKLTFSYWFVIILFFMLKKVRNISNYSVCDSFIFFFQSKKIFCIFIWNDIYFFFSLKRFLTSLIAVSSIYFFDLKRFVTCLIMLSSIFFIFEDLNFSSLYIVKK